MAVNNAFYSVINELYSRATGGTVTAVVDYDTFIEAGKTLATMSADDLQNTLIKDIMNKVKLQVQPPRLCYQPTKVHPVINMLDAVAHRHHILVMQMVI